jgi:DNA transformation protein
LKESTGLSELKNIGSTIEKRLNEIGVFSKEDLKKLGVVKAYQKIQHRNLGKSIPVCYYLYSLQGALENKH